MMMKALALAMLLGAAPAMAGDLRDFCPTRPGLGTNACTVDSGHVVAEVSAVDWTRQTDSDETLVGDTLLRFGVGEATEVRLGWTPFGVLHARGAGMTQRRVGDVTLGVRQNLASPDGSGFAAAVQPFVSLPVGRTPIGAGDWGAGVVVPLTWDLQGGWSVALTSEADAAVDADGDGRHFAASAVGGVNYEISKAVTATVELAAMKDDDPGGHTTAWLGSASLAWQPSDGLQLDVQAVAGLNRDAPDVELIAGFARRF